MLIHDCSSPFTSLWANHVSVLSWLPPFTSFNQCMEFWKIYGNILFEFVTCVFVPTFRPIFIRDCLRHMEILHGLSSQVWEKEQICPHVLIATSDILIQLLVRNSKLYKRWLPQKMVMGLFIFWVPSLWLIFPVGFTIPPDRRRLWVTVITSLRQVNKKGFLTSSMGGIMKFLWVMWYSKFLTHI